MSVSSCRNNNVQLCIHPKQRRRSKLTRYLDSAVADGSKKSGSVQSPMSGGGGMMIPTLPCGLWCHTWLCLWMAMCSSPLISNRWWETSKWWSFTKTSSQNKVKGTQKNTKWSHEKKKKKNILNGCRLCCKWHRNLPCALLLLWKNVIISIIITQVLD